MKVTVVTAGHLATCPRMVKAADALHNAGYEVRVISTRHTPWAVEADRLMHARRAWRWEAVDYSRRHAPKLWLTSGVRMKAATALAARANGHLSPHVAGLAFSRVHEELVDAITREPQDLICAGSGGAIAAGIEASRRTGTPCGVDFEDFHCGEHGEDQIDAPRDALAARVMADAAQHAAFLTAGSSAIADAVEERFGRKPTPINNVFTLPTISSAAPTDGPLRLYWFSQTIGSRRGLEDIIRAAGRARIDCELHLRGVAANGYVNELQALAEEEASTLRIVQHEPGDPDAMVESCRGFHAGIATEQTHTPNRALSLSNKALTYPLAGLALILTDTPGQRPLARDLGGDVLLYAPGDIDALAAGLARWSTNRAALRSAQAAAWDAARRRWHWDHEAERPTFLGLVRGILG